MDRVEYALSGVEKSILQGMPGSSSSDTVRIKVSRLSDGLMWDAVTQEFISAETFNSMGFVSDILWEFSFTPDVAGDYIAYIKNDTLDVEYLVHLIVSADPVLIPEGSWGSGLVVGENTFCTGDSAETYFATRWGAAKYWGVLSSAEKVSAMITAYNQLTKSGVFSLPETVTTSMIMAQLEQALFLVVHGEDAINRAGLIVQGVSSSGITKESYDSNMRGRIPICDAAFELVKEYYTRGEGNYVVTLQRDDDLEN